MFSTQLLLGYEPLISLNDVVQQGQPPTYRSLLYNLALAGFCAGNVMLFSFSEYLGLDDARFRHLFGVLNLILATPVVFYSGLDYFKSASACAMAICRCRIRWRWGMACAD